MVKIRPGWQLLPSRQILSPDRSLPRGNRMAPSLEVGAAPPATRQIDRHPSVDMFSVASGCASLARVVCKRPCRARAVRVRRAARVAVRASSSEENAGETLDDDLPPPIKLTADQARIAALAFEVLYEKDPVEDLEEMLKDKERPGLRLKLQQAIEGALALPLVSSSAASSFLDDSR